MDRIRSIKKSMALITAIVITIAVLPIMNLGTAYANAPSGIRNNGMDGISIDINASPYTDFANISNWGQYAYTNVGCAWFASARVKQLTGKGSTILSGKSWWNGGAGRYGFSTGRQPQAKALACYAGHVTVVEAVNGDTITISEGGRWDVPAANGYCTVDRISRAKLESARNGNFLGYVYLGNYQAPTPTPTITWTDEKYKTFEISERRVDLQQKVYASCRGTWTNPGIAWHRVGHPEEYKEYVQTGFSWTGTYIYCGNDLINEAKATLYPGIRYQYRLFSDFNGVRYTSPIKYFTMAGIHTHSYTEKITKEPTYTEDGVKTLTCPICGDVKTETIPKKVQESYTITFDPNGGTVSKTSMVVNKGNLVGNSPVPTREGYKFEGWYSEDGSQLYANSGVWENLTVKARWTKESQDKRFKLIYDANGGYSSTSYRNYTVSIDWLPTATRAGYEFDGWYTTRNGGQKLETGMTTNDNVEDGASINAYAHWTKTSEPIEESDETEEDSSEYTIYLNANGGSVSVDEIETIDKKITYLPTPYRNGYTFAGWYDNSDCLYSEGDSVSENLSLSARWNVEKTRLSKAYGIRMTRKGRKVTITWKTDEAPDDVYYKVKIRTSIWKNKTMTVFGENKIIVTCPSKRKVNISVQINSYDMFQELRSSGWAKKNRRV